MIIFLLFKSFFTLIMSNLKVNEIVDGCDI